MLDGLADREAEAAEINGFLARVLPVGGDNGGGSKLGRARAKASARRAQATDEL